MNLKQKLLKVFKKIKEYPFKIKLKENNLFLVTFLSIIINDLLLRAFTIGLSFKFMPFFGTFIVSLFLCSFSFLIKENKRFIYFAVLLFLSLLISISNSIYYTFYSSFISISLVSALFQLSDVKDALSESVFHIKDLIYLWSLLWFIWIVRQNAISKRKYSKKNDKKKFFKVVTVSIILTIIFVTSLNGVEKSLVQQWSREYIVDKFGIYIYQGNDIIRSIEPQINNMFGCDLSLTNVRNFYEEKDNKQIKNKYTNIFEGKNIIMIHAESMQTFLMDLEFNGEEVTPNLNRLSKEGMFFSNFYAQVGAGTSSDTELTINTSLLPVKSGTAFVSYWDREYMGIPKILKDKGYYTYSMHANIGTFWNRMVMHDKLGYDKFYSKSSYIIDEEIGLGLSDKSFFKQSIPIMRDIKDKNKNFYATLIMLTNHTPFLELEKYGEFDLSMTIEKENEIGVLEQITVPYMEGTRLGNYMKASRYADQAIGDFITDLDNNEMLDNTVIVIYGDHDSRISRKEYEKLHNYDPYTDSIIDKEDPEYKAIDYYFYELNRKVPLIIWSKDKKLNVKVDKTMGMYDVLPTLGNMFNFSSKYALGNDIFNVDDNMVVFSNGNWITDTIYYNYQKEEYIPLGTDVITADYIEKNTQKAEKLLSVSNDFITCNYIKSENSLLGEE